MRTMRCSALATWENGAAREIEHVPSKNFVSAEQNQTVGVWDASQDPWVRLKQRLIG